MYRRNLLSSIAVSALCITTFASETVAAQEQLNYNIPAQDLSVALRKFAKTSKLQVIFDGETARGKRSTPITNHNSPDAALRELLNGTGLTYQRNGKIYIISAAQTSSLTSPHLPSTLASAAAVQVQAQAQAPTPQYDEIIVTAQKKEERITDVPIAMSAFSAEALDNYKIEGGSELLRAVPNVAFSKTNFASYNFSIRGVGTKALSASTDPAVAISFNNVPLIRNRLFEQEYFDVNRVEVLRGPQGTLYGRNATGGVVNMLPNLPSFGEFEGNIKGEVGSFKSKRISGMLNVPLMDDLSIRIAGAMTKRDGYDFNEYTNNKVNGRDLYSIRTSALWSPNEKFRVTEHFSEDDNRSRTGKQLCHHDAGPESVGSQIIRDTPLARGYLSQGCLPGSIYEDAAFGVPNGLSMQQVQAAAPFSIGYGSDGIVYLINSNVDPYAGVTQSRNLRVINTQIDPIFRSKNNVFQINLEHEISDNFKFFSQSLYTDDYYYSNQDYNRFISNDIFNNSRNLNDFFGNPNPWREGFTPDGVLSDPQLGDSKKMVAMDLVNSKSSQYYQEFRVNSSLEGFFNFNIGLNYTKFKVDEDYYVFNNMFTVISKGLLGAYFAGREPTQCETIPNYDNCVYVDPNPIGKINGEGHNYFRSRNVSKTTSLGIFGESYFNLSQELKLTAGLRYTDDKKIATPYETQLLLAPGILAGGLIGRGLVASPDIKQKWGRLTGRLVIDWKPEISGLSDLLVYGSYSRGYKGGGANPPSIGFDPEKLRIFKNSPTFDPESIDAFEVGLKLATDDRKFNLSASAFYYDYSGYQISQIVDRMALNENFDAIMFGFDLEIFYKPTTRFSLNGNLGLLKSRIKNGEESIDVMDRTQGNPDWVVVKPWLQFASNCIVPVATVAAIIDHPRYLITGPGVLSALCGGAGTSDFRPGSRNATRFGISYDPATAPGSGRGFMAPLGGNELPSAPNWTMNLGAQYELPVSDWITTFRFDYYRQGSSWARVYNTEIDKLRSWDNVNFSIRLSNPKNDVNFEFYVKNIFDKDSITDSFLNSDDSGLTLNIFTVDPRIFGLSSSIKF